MILALVLLAGQTAMPKPVPPPTIPDADALAFFEAQAYFNEAQARIQAAGKKLQDDCGKENAPNLDKGKLTCVASPAPRPESKK